MKFTSWKVDYHSYSSIWNYIILYNIWCSLSLRVHVLIYIHSYIWILIFPHDKLLFSYAHMSSVHRTKGYLVSSNNKIVEWLKKWNKSHQYQKKEPHCFYTWLHDRHQLRDIITQHHCWNYQFDPEMYNLTTCLSMISAHGNDLSSTVM